MAEPLKYDPLRVQSIVNDFYKSIGEQPSGREGRPGLAEWGEDLGQIDPRVLKAVRAGVKANVMPTKSTPVPYGGLLESTTSLPALPFFIGDLLTGGKHELAKKAPEFAVEASDEYDRLVNKYLQKEGLDEATRLSGPQQFGLAAGEMIGQLPIPGRILKKVTNVLPAALKPAGWLAEYFGPTIEPKVSNYAVGTGVGGTLRTATSEPEGYAKGGLRRAPIRATAEGVVETLPPKLEGTTIMKDPGGNWVLGAEKNILERLIPRGPASRDEALLIGGHWTDLADTPEGQQRIARNASLTDWLQNKLGKYMRNEMGTERDPLRLLAERDVLHYDPSQFVAPSEHNVVAQSHRKMAGMPVDPIGVSTLAKDWEAASDSAIMPAAPYRMQIPMVSDREAANRYLEQMGGEFAVKNPNAPAYSFSTGANASNLGFDHLVDELKNAMAENSGLPDQLRLKPENLSKLSVPQAVQLVSKINKWREKTARQASLKGMLDATVHKDYPEQKMRWVQLDKPGQFASESNAMGHSVRGYEPPDMGGSLTYGLGGWDAIKGGRAKIYSLRDTKTGEPHVTIEVSSNKKIRNWSDLEKAVGPETAQAYWEKLSADPAYKTNPDEVFDEFVRSAGIEGVPSINQIKGKGNRKPADKYIPFVQDFVRSGKWSEIKDPQNTGMRLTRHVFNPGELKLLADMGEYHIPDVLTGEDIQRLHNMIIPEGQRLKYDADGNVIGSERENYGEGGAVEYDKSRVKKLVDDFRQTMLGVPRKLKQAAADITEIGPIIKRSNEIPLKYFDEKTEVDGAADAMRHILFQGQLMRKYGETPAKTISYVHEYTSPGQAAEARAMDLYNDEIGRELGRVAKSDEELIDLAEKYVRSGKAKTLSGSRGGY